MAQEYEVLRRTIKSWSLWHVPPSISVCLASCAWLVVSTGIAQQPHVRHQAGSDQKSKPNDGGVIEEDPQPKVAAATVKEAAKVLDLRTEPLMDGGKLKGKPSLSTLDYSIEAKPRDVIEFHRKRLLELGFKQISGDYPDATVGIQFRKDGFLVQIDAPPESGLLALLSAVLPSETSAAVLPKTELLGVRIHNYGNVDARKLPVPPAAKVVQFEDYTATYETDASVDETADACRSLLEAAGWEAYGPALGSNSDTITQDFKLRAILLKLYVRTIGKNTWISLTPELIQADLPSPPDVRQLHYLDAAKQLQFTISKDRTDAVIAFYQKRLTQQGWLATTPRPTVVDAQNSQSMIYRNELLDRISLKFDDVRNQNLQVLLSHQTAAEVGDEMRRVLERGNDERGSKRSMKKDQ